MTAEPAGYVVHTSQIPWQQGPGDNLLLCIAIDQRIGCQNLLQRILRFAPGRSTEFNQPGCEEVLYVVSGQGAVVLDGTVHAISPGTGVLVPDRSRYTVVNPGPEEVVLVSVISPQPGRPPSPLPDQGAQARLPADEHRTTTEAAEQPQRTGDRIFKRLIDPRHGCRNVTQFIGFIPPGRAPFHTHTYEEVIHIVEGEGIAHVGRQDFEIRAGSSVYLPPLLPHCLENTGREPIRLLGVFSPAGDPSSKASEEHA